MRKRIVRFISVVICLIMCISVFPGDVFAEETITSITVTGLTEPAAGNEPVATWKDLGRSMTYNTGICTVQTDPSGWFWDPEETGKYDSRFMNYGGDPLYFEAGLTYMYTLEFRANSGYEFGENVSVTINGKTATMKKSSNKYYRDFNVYFTVPGEEKTIQFNGNGAAGSMTEIKAMQNHHVTLPECGFEAPYGKEFVSWVINGNDHLPGESYKLTDNVVATPKWDSAATFNVYFVNNGHGGNMPSFSDIPRNSLILPPDDPHEDGYVFKGWYRSSDCQAESRFDFDTDKITGDTTLYAKWMPLIYEIEITNLNEPVIDRTPAQIGTSLYAVPADAKYYVVDYNSGWMYDGNGTGNYNYRLNNNETFKEGVTYVYSAQVVPDENYEFAPEVTATINGMPATVKARETMVYVTLAFIPKEAVTHKISVVNGSADKINAMSGDYVSIFANRIEGKIFKEWKITSGIVSGFTNTKQNNTGFYMGDTDVTVEAKYVSTVKIPVPVDDTFNGNSVKGYTTSEDESLFDVSYGYRYDSNPLSGLPTIPGYYKVVFSLKDKNNYAWDDGTTADKTIYFRIYELEINTVPEAELIISVDDEIGTQYQLKDLEWSGIPEGMKPGSVGSSFASWNGLSQTDGIITVYGTPSANVNEITCTLHIDGCNILNKGKLTIIVNNHNSEKVDAVSATCTSNGVKAYYHCKDCGKNFSDESCAKEITDFNSWKNTDGCIPAAHTWNTEKTTDVNPGCETEGSASYHCIYCTATKDSSPVPPLGHSFTNYVSDNNATCTADGTKTAKCDRCEAKETITDVGSKKAHSYEWRYNNDATAEKDGTETQICAVCSAEGETRTKAGTCLNPTLNAKLNVAKETSKEYRTLVTVKATASDVYGDCKLVLTVNGKTYTGNSSEVSSDAFEIKGDVSYTVKIVGADGNVQKDKDGNTLEKESKVTMTNVSFFKRIILWFKGLFGKLPADTVKPD